MRKLIMFLLVVFILVSVCGVFDAYAKSSKNKAACVAWCKKNKPRCEFCDSKVFCGGRTYDVIKSFKKGTGNWYACGLSEWELNSRENERRCKVWCENHEECKSCTSDVCGSGKKHLRRFGGSGKNWYACQSTKMSERRHGWKANKAACEKWCEKNEKCEKCTNLIGCGKGLKLLRRFSGSGENWYACQKTSWARNTERVKAEAEKWCEDYKKSSGKDCRIVKSGKSCPDAFYKSDRLKVSWGRDYKICLPK